MIGTHEFSLGQLPDRVKKFVHIINGERWINPDVLVTGYHKSFGITNGEVDRSGYAILLNHEERKNGFQQDQTPSFNREFIVYRNKAGNGGSPGAFYGESASIVGCDGQRNFKSRDGAMSYRHEFVMPLDTSFWWCNAAYFGKGPGKYAPKGTLDMLIRMKQVAFEWAVKHRVRNPFFGFHEYPNNSLFHLHLHMIDLDQVNDKDKNIVLPGYTAHFSKTTPLDYYINKMAHQAKLDRVPTSLSPKPPKDIFWIIGAPTHIAYDAVRDAYEQNHNMEIVVCASLTTYVQKIFKQVKPDIQNLPTNFRTHHANCLQMNTTLIHDLKSYKESQEEVSRSLVYIFNFCKVNNIPVHFACPPRNLRPIYIRQNKNTRQVYADINPIFTLQEDSQQQNLQLSNLILTNLLIPSFVNEEILEDVMEKSCEHGATFMADVLTVGCALVLEEPSCWRKKCLDSPAIVAKDGCLNLSKGRNQLKSTCVLPQNSTEICYVDANFRDAEGPFKSFADDGASISKVKEKLMELLSKIHPEEKDKIWGKSIIFHDARLNDIDDEPAILLISSLSKTTSKIQNHSLVNQVYKEPDDNT